MILVETEGVKFDPEVFPELYRLFVTILQDFLSENIANQFYSSLK